MGVEPRSVENEDACASATLQDSLSKKKKKKKKQGKLAKEPDHSTGEPSVMNGRPGKKKLRKLRYQQKELSPFDFCLVSAKSSVFTNSTLLGPSFASLDTHNNGSSSSSGERILEVSTVGSLSPNTYGQNDAVKDTKKNDKHQVYVQPLLVLDLNGILCHRIRQNRTPNVPKTAYRSSSLNVARTPVVPRTDLHEFLSFLDRHFTLSVWTSAKNKTATSLVSALFPSDVASRLLFVWAQHHCDVVGSPDTDETDDEQPVFEKNLSKVWKEFPLWNANNTLMIDDSPEKCTQWHANAVHPPPLNGQVSTWSGNTSPDEENERLQRLFFNDLVEFWRNHTLVQRWDEESGDATTSLIELHGGNEEPLHDSNGLLQHLKDNATGHMGWK